ncbi:MAG: ABC transporter ATP-binding protein [Clostridiales bacterium]|nr:ABC transporter ATP-binding protein [Clostridiales bacterium]
MNSYLKDNVLEVKGVSKKYIDEKIIENIDIVLKKEEFVTILGPSGSGKSTLFNIISGLINPEEGQIFINGENVTGQTGFVSYMHQKDLLLPWRDVVGNGAIPLEIKGFSKKESRDRVEKMLHIFELQEHGHKFPMQLSGGMRQRVSLLRTYMFSSEIMLLDEPFGGLDAITKFKMQQYLRDVIRKIKGSVLFITHDIEEAIFLSDRIYVINGNPAKVVEEISVDLNRPRNEEIIASDEFRRLKSRILKLL